LWLIGTQFYIAVAYMLLAIFRVLEKGVVVRLP